MSTTIITGRLIRLAEQLGDLRGRLKQAARFEVAQAIGDALAETAKMLICGTARPPREEYETPPWDDPWRDPFTARPSWSHDRIEERDSVEHSDRRLPAHSVLFASMAIARLSLMRTGQPTVAIGLASLTAILVLIAGDRIKPLLDVCTTAQELLDYPKRRL
jgi:hypothetical protein